jgi:uncharacterized protein (TIGR01244 family)
MGNAERFAPGLYAGGQPSPQELARLLTEGVRTVINLRGAGEPVEFNEAEEAARIGLHYVALPVSGAQDLTPRAVERFSRELESARERGDVFVHCATSNRVGALVALDQGLTHGADDETAMALGRAAGLTSLEPVVRELLGRRTTG